MDTYVLCSPDCVVTLKISIDIGGKKFTVILINTNTISLTGILIDEIELFIFD